MIFLSFSSWIINEFFKYCKDFEKIACSCNWTKIIKTILKVWRQVKVQVLQISPVQVLQISPVQVLQISPVQVLQNSPVQILQNSPVQVLQISPVQVLQICAVQVLHNLSSPGFTN